MSDPGTKHQHGWDFSYADEDPAAVSACVADLMRKHPKMIFSCVLLGGDEISNAALLAQVKTRSKFTGYFASDDKLARGMQCHCNLERCGLHIRDMESTQSTCAPTCSSRKLANPSNATAPNSSRLEKVLMS